MLSFKSLNSSEIFSILMGILSDETCAKGGVEVSSDLLMIRWGFKNY